MRVLFIILILVTGISASAQLPPLDEGGVSQELAKWRAAQYSNVRYKLDLTLEKMSPVLKGTMEIRVTQAAYACAEPDCPPLYIVLDWRKIPGHEKDSTISNVELNGTKVQSASFSLSNTAAIRAEARTLNFYERNEHLIFHEGVKMGENVIKLDFTSPILTSGSAITRYIDKEDGSEYIYSLFVPSDASTAFPVFDQPDLKARFTLRTVVPAGWRVIANSPVESANSSAYMRKQRLIVNPPDYEFFETRPISAYVFAFAAGPWMQFVDDGTGRKIDPPFSGGLPPASRATIASAQGDGTRADTARKSGSSPTLHSPGGAFDVYVRKSQAAKFQPHAAEIFRLTREAVKHLETYFDYKFPWPKYDLVLIPEFPFGGMEHAGATFLRESSIIFPTEPTKSDFISRANLIFHETAHQWFGDTVTMRWFDDLWLKEGFAEFMAYKTLEKVMPEANAWKVFYERNKQAAYATDSTRGTTPIYQPIKNLSAAKSAYGNIVYRKAPSFLRQAEFYLGEDKFQTAVRAFLKKHAFANAGWEDLVREFEAASKRDLQVWAKQWVTVPGLPIARSVDVRDAKGGCFSYGVRQTTIQGEGGRWEMRLKPLLQFADRKAFTVNLELREYGGGAGVCDAIENAELLYFLPNYQDYGYGIFLLDDKSRDYVLKNIQNEKDPFLRSMMWGALWDSIREAELDPRVYVELVIKNLPTEPDETTVASLLGRVSTALNYYMPSDAEPIGSPRVSTGSSRSSAKVEPSLTVGLRTRFETILLDRLQKAPTSGQRITFFRAFVNNASTEKSRAALKEMLRQASSTQRPLSGGLPPAGRAVSTGAEGNRTRSSPTASGGSPTLNGPGAALPLKTKDKFDIVTRLAVLNDPDAPRLLAELEKTETSDDAKRYAYAARAAFATAENRAKFWNDFVNNKQISESWIEAAIGPFNSIRNASLSQPYLERALNELPNLKRTRKIFFVNNWLGAWIGGQRDERALAIVNKFLTDHPQLDNDLRLKILENIDVVERAVRIRGRYGRS